MEAKVDDTQCLKCKHTWASRVKEPKQCPNCHNTLHVSKINSSGEYVNRKEHEGVVESSFGVPQNPNIEEVHF